MRADLPREVEVGTFTYTVDFGPKATLELAHDGDFGKTDHDSLTIKIRSDVHPDVAAETLLHEMMHAAWAQTPLAQMLTSDQEEQVIRALCPLLFRWSVLAKELD